MRRRQHTPRSLAARRVLELWLLGALLIPAVALGGATQTKLTIVRISNGAATPALGNAHHIVVYMSTGDGRNHSTCYGHCTKNWQPLLAKGTLVAGSGVNRTLIGTASRKTGPRQVTYSGHPVYLYVQYPDSSGTYGGEGCGVNGGPGDTGDHNARWYILTPKGKPDKNETIGCQGY